MALIQPAGQKPETFVATIGPFVGCRDTVELAAQDMRRAASMLNCYVELPELGGDVMQRAGFVQRSQPSTITGVSDFIGPTYAASPYITPTGTLTNLMLIKRDGTTGLGTTSYFFNGSKAWPIIQYDAPTTYTLASSSGTSQFAINDLDTAANRMFVTALGDYAIYAQSGGLVHLFDYAANEIFAVTDLTDNVFGRPCIYYGKAFFILNSDRSTIVWSEENDPDIGYQATGYDNFWTFRQTSNAPIMGLAGTNQYLFVFRQNSITSIEGAVNSDFRSFGTLEGVSTTLGTLAPDTIVNVGDGVWFLDQYARPHAIVPGQGLIPLWENMRVTLNSIDLTPSVQFGYWGRYIPNDDVVVFKMQTTGGTAKLYAFSSRTFEWLGEWQFTGGTVGITSATMSWGATMFSNDGRPMLAVETIDTQPLDNFVTQKANTEADQRDEYTTGPIPAINNPSYVTTPRIAGDLDEVINTRLIVASGRRLGGIQAIKSVAFQGSNSSFDVSASMASPAVATDGEPCRYVYGATVTQSRWVQARLLCGSNTTANSRMSLGTVRIYGTRQRQDPALP